MAIKVRIVTCEDWQDVKRIYEAGIETKIATFELKAPETYEEWFGQANPTCSFVAYDENQIWSWCKLSPVSKRIVYKGVGEVSIYIAPHGKGKGIGDLLLKHLIVTSEKEGFGRWNPKSLKRMSLASIYIKRMAFVS